NIFSTVDDLLKWNENLDSGRVGGKKLARAMQTPGVLNDGRKMTYAGGLEHSVHHGVPTIWHNVGRPGFYSHLMRVPSLGLSIACLNNTTDTGDATDISLKVVDSFRKEVKTRGKAVKQKFPSPIQLSAADLKSFEGIFEKPDDIPDGN